MPTLKRLLTLPLLAAQACGQGTTAPDPRLTFSFEEGMEGWTATAADTGTSAGAHAVWSIKPSTERAYSGRAALKFSVANDTDAAKIWVVRPFPVTPGGRYDVTVSYAFGTADWGDANLFVLLTGVFQTPPTDGSALLAGTVHGSTYNGARSDEGYRWLQKSIRDSVRASASGSLYIVIGIWGTWETSRIYYLDDVAITLTPR